MDAPNAPNAPNERTDAWTDALRPDEREPAAAPHPTLRPRGDGTPVPVESYRDVASSTTHLHPALVNPDLTPTYPALQAEGETLALQAIVATMRSPEFIPSVEREMRLNPLLFLRAARPYFSSRDGSSPSVVLNNIITAIPRGPLDALPEGFRRN